MIKNILKGFIIGIGKIIPGVSGSMLAISLNVYERLLLIIANITRINFSSFKFLSSILFGVMISIVVFSKTIAWLLNGFYLPIMLLFIGLIIGGLPDVILEIKESVHGVSKWKTGIIFLFSFLFSYAITLVGSLKMGIGTNGLIVFILGLIEAFSSIVPGISGTAIYMSLGVYDVLLDLFSNLFNPSYLHLTILFGSGVLAGTYIIANIVMYLLHNQKHYTFVAIFGFMLSAILIMFIQIFSYTVNQSFDGYFIFEFLIGVCLCYVGYVVTRKINNFSGNR